MSTLLTGGCMCGAVRYEYDGEIGESSYCHCDDCKRATGGPYTVGVLSQADKGLYTGGGQLNKDVFKGYYKGPVGGTFTMQRMR